MNERDIFAAALDIDDPGRRAAFVAENCGDDSAARPRVEAMLKFHDDNNSFLNVPIVDPTPSPTTSADVAEQPGSVIGRYKLLEKIGEGGFGLVYMAEQREPVDRRVALKIIKLGMDTRQVVGRFEAERQALAMMEHPHIAKVFDGGATETGRPYFVMELVKGFPITEFCDANRLCIRERLKLFMQVCDAVQHAHHKGIIHRDLKPSNVLVALHDDRAVPKVIDFGVAKAMQQRLTEKTVFTRFQQIIGTPAYMSPEQASFSDLDVDTRSDIYSLGVLLYELLTGATPLSMTSAREVAYDEMCRIIREQEPDLPSVFLSRPSDELPLLSRNRSSDAASLQSSMRGDIDWIVMKALEKDRTRRYESVTAFGQDIERFLNHHPVLAGPPSIAYKLKKFANRNRTWVAVASGFLALGLFAVITLVAVLAFVGFRNQQISQLNADRENEVVRAEDNLFFTQSVVDDMLTKVADNHKFLRDNPGTQTLRIKFLQLARDYYEQFADQHQTAGFEKELVSASSRLGFVLRQTGELDAAAQQFHEAIRIFEQGHELDAAYRERVAYAYFGLGLVAKSRREPEKAVVYYDQAINIFQQLDPSPENQFALVKSYINRGNVDLDLSKPADAKSRFEKAISICERLESAHADPEYKDLQVRAYISLGLVDDDPVTQLEKAIHVGTQLVEDRPVPEYVSSLAKAHHNLGAVFAKKDANSAIGHLQKAVELGEKLVAQNSSVPEYEYDLAAGYTNLGGTLSRKQPTKAMEILERAVVIFNRHDQTSSSKDLQYDMNSSFCRVNLASLCLGKRDYKRSRELLKKAKSILESVLSKSPDYQGAKEALQMIRLLESEITNVREF